jgi:sugar O-acyltransferase (sialic acid O-acetyltransferase NeuD family)
VTLHEQSDVPPLVFLGAGTNNLAREALQIAEDAGRTVVGFVDEDASKQEETLDDVPVYSMDEAAKKHPDARVICTLGTTRRKSFIQRALTSGFTSGTLVHPSARVPDNTVLDEGCWLHPGAVIASHTTIGRHVLVNRGALIGHDVEIGSFCTVAPGANIGGVTSIGSQVYVGMGATIRNSVSIGDGALIGAGAVVVDDVPARTKVLGVPAKTVDTNIERY